MKLEDSWTILAQLKCSSSSWSLAMWKTLHTYIAQLCITTLGSSSKTLVLVKLAQFWFDLRIWVVGPAFFELDVKQEGIYREFQLKGWFTSHLVWNLYEPRTCLVSNNPYYPKTHWSLADLFSGQQMFSTTKAKIYMINQDSNPTQLMPLNKQIQLQFIPQWISVWFSLI